jgi:16S rRNA C1402 (ribose-2'-O) methylase RsmI
MHGGFVFAGWVPERGAARAKFLEDLLQEERPIVCLESPKRVRKLFAAIGELLSSPAPAPVPTAAAPALQPPERRADESSAFTQRRVVICRELTKRHETVRALNSLGAAVEWVASPEAELRGELTIVFGSAVR